MISRLPDPRFPATHATELHFVISNKVKDIIHSTQEIGNDILDLDFMIFCTPGTHTFTPYKLENTILHLNTELRSENTQIVCYYPSHPRQFQ